MKTSLLTIEEKILYCIGNILFWLFFCRLWWFISFLNLFNTFLWVILCKFTFEWVFNILGFIISPSIVTLRILFFSIFMLLYLDRKFLSWSRCKLEWFERCLMICFLTLPWFLYKFININEFKSFCLLILLLFFIWRLYQ